MILKLIPDKEMDPNYIASPILLTGSTHKTSELWLSLTVSPYNIFVSKAKLKAKLREEIICMEW